MTRSAPRRADASSPRRRRFQWRVAGGVVRRECMPTSRSPVGRGSQARCTRRVWPHVLATLARGPLVARLDDQRRSTRGAIHRSAILARSTASMATPHGWQKPSPPRTLDISDIPGLVEDYRQAARKGENSHARRSETRQQVSRHCAAEPRQRDGNTVKPGSRIPDRAGIFSRLLLTERSSSVDELRRAPSTGIDCQLLQAGHSLS